jgi:hypothetical protein
MEASIYTAGSTWPSVSGTATVSTGSSWTSAVNTNKMKQVKAALFIVVRDEKTNEIISAEFVKEFWFSQKSGVSFDVAAAHANGFAPNPDTEVIREIQSLTF